MTDYSDGQLCYESLASTVRPNFSLIPSMFLNLMILGKKAIINPLPLRPQSVGCCTVGGMFVKGLKTDIVVGTRMVSEGGGAGVEARHI